MANNISVAAGAFGKSDACTMRRQFALELGDSKGAAFKKSVIITETVKEILKGKIKKDRTEVFNVLSEKFEDIPYENAKQRQMHCIDATKQVMRYVTCEKRHPVFVSTRRITLQPGFEVTVSPTFMYVGYTDDGKPYAELVKLKTSRPRLTQTAVSKATDPAALELYSMLVYMRDMVKPGNEVKLVASLYYLRKNNDRSSLAEEKFDTDFFNASGSGNVVSLSEIYENRGYKCCLFDENRTEPCTDDGYSEGCPYAYMCIPSVRTATDNLYQPLIDAYLAGIPADECSDDDCKNCDLFAMCKYADPPRQIVKQPVVKSVRDLTLSKEQEAAIAAEKGIWRINAGAGVGKTLVVSLRYVALEQKGAKENEILMITFTKAGAEEMKSRIVMYANDFGLKLDPEKMFILTFNAFGDIVLKDKYAELGFTEQPKVIDDVERSMIIKKLLDKHPIDGLDYRNFSLDMKNCKGALAIAKRVFSIVKETQATAAEFNVVLEKLGGDHRFATKEAILSLIDLYDEYDMILHEQNLIEFEDQNQMVFSVLDRDPYYLENFGFKHVIVDEFQDSNEDQIRLIKKLRDCPSFESLMVVGDDSQAIFGFRATSPKYILDFDKIMAEPVDDIYLLENRRSTPEIIEFANSINELNVNKIAKNLVATRPHGKPVIVKGFVDKEEESNYVVQGIAEHLANGFKPEDIAVICANKYELIQMGNALGKANIPSVMLNPELLVENSRVLAAIALSNALQDTSDTKDMMIYANAVMDGGILNLSVNEQKQKIDEVREKIEEVRKLPDDKAKQTYIDMLNAINPMEDEVFQNFVDTLGFKNMSAIYDYNNHFMDYGAKNAVRRVHDYPGVVLTTAHSSKGLEWPVVYNMISKYDSQELNTGSAVANDLTEERRRLLFVSATRARDELYVTGQYVAYGKKGDYHYNKFLKDAYDVTGRVFSIANIEAEKEALKNKRYLETHPEAAERLKEKEKKDNEAMTDDMPKPKKTRKSTTKAKAK